MSKNDKDRCCPSSATNTDSESQRSAQIRRLNDQLRRTLTGGRIIVTAGVAALEGAEIAKLWQRVREFEEFTPDNDPYGEHDFGAFEAEGQRFFWKIDYYDKTLSAGSEDPADPAQTCRVLTLMLADEY
jgi:Protein of unknown function (DUF3768)